MLAVVVQEHQKGELISNRKPRPSGVSAGRQEVGDVRRFGNWGLSIQCTNYRPSLFIIALCVLMIGLRLNLRSSSNVYKDRDGGGVLEGQSSRLWHSDLDTVEREI